MLQNKTKQKTAIFLDKTQFISMFGSCFRTLAIILVSDVCFFVFFSFFE